MIKRTHFGSSEVNPEPSRLKQCATDQERIAAFFAVVLATMDSSASVNGFILSASPCALSCQPRILRE